MKKFAALLFSMSLILPGCGGGKYADLKSAIDSIIQIQETYFSSLQKAQSAQDVASAINSYTDSIMQITPALNGMIQKYPEIKNSDTPPAELKDSFDRLARTREKFAGLIPILKNYQKDDVVQKAMERQESLMSGK